MQWLSLDDSAAMSSLLTYWPLLLGESKSMQPLHLPTHTWKLNWTIFTIMSCKRSEWNESFHRFEVRQYRFTMKFAHLVFTEFVLELLNYLSNVSFSQSRTTQTRWTTGDWSTVGRRGGWRGGWRGSWRGGLRVGSRVSWRVCWTVGWTVGWWPVGWNWIRFVLIISTSSWSKTSQKVSQSSSFTILVIIANLSSEEAIAHIISKVVKSKALTIRIAAPGSKDQNGNKSTTATLKTKCKTMRNHRLQNEDKP